MDDPTDDTSRCDRCGFEFLLSGLYITEDDDLPRSCLVCLTLQEREALAHLKTTLSSSGNMFRAEPGVFESEDVLAGRAMADIATIGIMHERLVREAELRTEQLRHALDGRAAVERAKGVLAERHKVSPGQAFTLLWDHARRNGRPLSEVCSEIAEGTLTIG